MGQDTVGALTIATLAQPLLNMALFIPLGVLGRVMTGRGVPTALLAALAASLLSAAPAAVTAGTWLWCCRSTVADCPA